MSWLLVAFYILLGIFIFYKWKRFANATLSAEFITGVFILKSFLSILYIIVHQRYYGGGDTFAYYNDGLIIFKSLFENPAKYFLLCFGPNNIAEVPSLIFKEVDAMGYWWDTSAFSVVRFYAITNLFTWGNIYASGIFMAFISTVGLILLHNVVAPFLYGKNLMVKIVLFAIPSVMFFTSGVHKEGLLVFFIGIFFYSLNKLFNSKIKAKPIVTLVLSAFAIWLVRDFIFYFLLPGIIAFLWCKLHRGYVLHKFIAVYLVAILIGQFIQFNIKDKGVVYKGNALESISIKQHSFESLKNSNTSFSIENFNPQLQYFVTHLHSAFFRTLLVPFHLTSFNNYQAIFIIENIYILLLLVYLLFNINFNSFISNPLAIWHFIFAISIMVLIGFVVSNIGASVRYRSLPLLFLFLSLLPTSYPKNNL
jgi:hypothetical protein